MYWSRNSVVVKKFNHPYKSSMPRTPLRQLTMFISDSWWISLLIKLVTMILLNVTKIKMYYPISVNLSSSKLFIKMYFPISVNLSSSKLFIKMYYPISVNLSSSKLFIKMYYPISVNLSSSKLFIKCTTWYLSISVLVNYLFLLLLHCL
jgi:hypothetical protein